MARGSATTPHTGAENGRAAAARVGLAARNEVMARRIIHALGASGLAVDEAAQSLDALVGECAANPPEVIVAAEDGSVLSSVSRLRELRRRIERTPLVLVVQSTDGRLLRKAMAAGVEGCVRETDLERALALTIRAVLTGQLCVPLSIRELTTPAAFSHREKQVLGLVAKGCTNYEIARRLFLSESTVKSHLSSVFRKLGVNSRQEAAAVVLDPEHGVGARVLALPDDESGDPVTAGS